MEGRCQSDGRSRRTIVDNSTVCLGRLVELLFSGTLSVGSLVYFYRLATNPVSLAIQLAVRVQAYGTPDVVFTTILVLLLLTNILVQAIAWWSWTRRC